MNSRQNPLAQDPAQSRFKWWLVIALIFCAQLGLILGLSDYSPVRARPAAHVPALHLATLT